VNQDIPIYRSGKGNLYCATDLNQKVSFNNFDHYQEIMGFRMYGDQLVKTREEYIAD
jgi:hypothetical protein